MTIKEFLSSRGIAYRTHGRNTRRGWLQVCCLFHPDNGYHLGINLESGTYSCWVCKAKGSFIKLVETVDDCDYHLARDITDRIGISKERKPLTVVRTEPADRDLLGQFPENFPKIYRQYLEGRNFDPDFIREKYKIRHGGNIGRYSYRIIIPIFQNSLPVSFTARSVTNHSKAPRYLDCEEGASLVPSRHLVYNLDSVKEEGRIGILEGTTDVWRMGDGFVATLTTGFNKNQVLSILRKRPKQGFVLYDPGKEAQSQALRLALQLSMVGGIPMERVEIEGSDPGDLPQEAADYLRRELMG